MRKGDWILTYTGGRFYPLDPRPEDIDIRDIAHALSLTCRYNGHCKMFYSVAEHSVRMLLEESLPGLGIWKLLHDAAEAYISDVPKPIKPMLKEFRPIEDNILRVIAERFGLPPYPKDDIHHSDMVMQATEKRDVIRNNGPEWVYELPPPLPGKIVPWSPHVAEFAFRSMARAWIKPQPIFEMDGYGAQRLVGFTEEER